MDLAASDPDYRGVRRRVLDAARAMLRCEHARAFTMDAVARAAGLSRRTVYNQFEDRDALRRSVWLELLNEVEATLPRSIADAPTVHIGLESFANACFANFALAPHRELRAAVAHEGSGMAGLASLYRERVELPPRWAVERYLLVQAHRGTIAFDQPEAEARRLLAMIGAAIAAAGELPAFTAGEVATIFLARISRPALHLAADSTRHATNVR